MCIRDRHLTVEDRKCRYKQFAFRERHSTTLWLVRVVTQLADAIQQVGTSPQVQSCWLREQRLARRPALQTGLWTNTAIVHLLRSYLTLMGPIGHALGFILSPPVPLICPLHRSVPRLHEQPSSISGIMLSLLFMLTTRFSIVIAVFAASLDRSYSFSGHRTGALKMARGV